MQRNMRKEQETNQSDMANIDLYNAVRNVPDSAKKTIAGGKLKGFTDINPMWRIKTLTEQFGVCGFGWYTEIIDRWKEECDGEAVVFVKIHLFVKMNNEWSQPIVGVGGSSLVRVVNRQNGSYADLSDEAYKMAYTDAISIACKALGMGADVYYEKDRTKYDVAAEQPSQAVQARRKAASRPVQAAPAPSAYTPVEQGLFNRMVENYVCGVAAKDGGDYRTAWINYTHAGEAEIAIFDNAVIEYKIACGIQ